MGYVQPLDRARFAVLAVVGAVACGGGSDTAPTFDFRSSDPGWTAGFADVSIGFEQDIGFVADHRPLPPPLSGSGLYQRGDNRSDDLFMWFAGRADGYVPDAEYELSFRVGIASRAGEACEAGIAAATFVKTGAVPFEPARVAADGSWKMNLDKGIPAGDGANALTLGDIRNALPGCPSVDPPWGARVLSSGGRTLRVRADPAGALWFFVGTDSAWEGWYQLYFTYLDVEATRVGG